MMESGHGSGWGQLSLKRTGQDSPPAPLSNDARVGVRHARTASAVTSLLRGEGGPGGAQGGLGGSKFLFFGIATRGRRQQRTRRS